MSKPFVDPFKFGGGVVRSQRVIGTFDGSRIHESIHSAVLSRITANVRKPGSRD